MISKDIREVRDAIKYIEENYDIVDRKDYLESHPSGSGYRSYHCIIKDKETGFEAEIQVRTENEDIWANVFHDLYKPHEAKMRKALDSNPEGVKKYANDYSNYLYNIDCCQVYGTVPDLPTELAQAGFSYSDEAEHDETNFFDAMMGEIYEMTPDYGFNVVIFDDYSPDGEKLTLIGNYDNEQDANTIKQQCEAQGKVTYIYKPDGTYESFVEDEHPRDGDGQFTSKDDGGLNSRVEQKQNVIQSQIDYLQKSMKPESQKYRAFQKVTDEDRSIRYNNKSLQEDIDKLKLEIDSPDTTGLPHLPLKQNTHAVQTIEGGMSWKEGNNEPLEGFKKGNTAIDVNVPLEREGDDFGYNKVKADRQINTLKLMWNSLGDEERDTIKSFTIERTPKLIVEDKEGGGLIYVNMDDVATAGYWRPSENKLCMRVDYNFDDDQLKGTFTHEVGHSLWHSIKSNHPERTEAWKVACKKIPPTTKYGKYNKKNWTDMKKMFDKYEKEGWSEFPENERDEKRANAIKNVEFYEDRYYNELHSEVHMYMMGNNKYKRGVVTKGVEKFLEPYKALHGLI